MSRRVRHVVAVLLVSAGLSAVTTEPVRAGATDPVQLVADPGFEDVGTAPCFVPATGDAVVRRTTRHALTGSRSLLVRLGGRASAVCAPGPDAATALDAVSGTLQVRNTGGQRLGAAAACLRVTLASGTAQRECTSVARGTRTTLRPQLSLGGESVTGVAWTVRATRRGARLLLDQARLVITPSFTGDPVCDPDAATPAGPPPADAAYNDNELPGASSYVPTPPDFRAQRPFVPLEDYTASPADDPVAAKFKDYVDRALAGDRDYGYSPTDAVVMYARSGQQKYIRSAIDDVEQQVRAAELAMALGEEPVISGDDYLEVGPMMQELALTYDEGQSLLTASQRERWKRYGDQVLTNVWTPQRATWGDCAPGTYEWNGWSINNPANNYSFSFMQATLLWTMATQEQQWVDFVQTYKFPLITNVYEQLPGGGSPEGTGYGTAQRRLWEYAREWAEGTGEHLTAVETHARESIDYWVHATVPTLDEFAPVGDLSRESRPNLYDYQENLVREAAMAAPDTPESGRALWWIRHNSVPDDMANSFNLRDALLDPIGTATKPTALIYQAEGVGQVFVRSSWQTDATWLTAIAGRYDESHAHAEQGSFNLHHGTWLAVTSNIWSHSGLEGNTAYEGFQMTGASNVVRFDRSAGTVEQNYATSQMTVTPTADGADVAMDLSPAYADSAGRVTSWTRQLSFAGSSVSVHDECTVGASVTPVWQLHVPVKPTASSGQVVAGGLTLGFDPSYDVTLVQMSKLDSDFDSGWRIELRNPGTCGFDVALDAT